MRNLTGGGASASRLSLLPMSPDFEARLASLETAMASVRLLAPLSRAQILKALGATPRAKCRDLGRRLGHFSVHVIHRRGK